MPCTDILNPQPGWDPELGDSMNPSYGFTRKRASTQLRVKAVGGVPWTRETQNTGHTFPLTWLGRTWACAQRIKWYYEQYEDGFFTIIDWDGGARHYVGRFTTEPNIVETANNRYDIQNVVFEEMPTVPMVQYPGDWDHDAVRFYASNDFGDQKVATSGTWALTAHTFGGVAMTTMDGTGAANDWAQYEYRGYGFKLYLLQGPGYGQCQVELDGIVVPTMDGGAITTVECYSAVEIGPQIVCVQQNASLDIHRVKVIALGTKNVAATGTVIGWHSLQVMR